jgi:hypothetical protein
MTQSLDAALLADSLYDLVLTSAEHHADLAKDPFRETSARAQKIALTMAGPLERKALRATTRRKQFRLVDAVAKLDRFTSLRMLEEIRRYEKSHKR